VIGSSSLAYDVTKERYPIWAYLPYITDPEFNQALQMLIVENDISGIYTPNLFVWTHLNKILSKLNSNVLLLNCSPLEEDLIGYQNIIKKAHLISEQVIDICSDFIVKENLTQQELTALLWHADTISGMCDNEKIVALCEIARRSVYGDIVEIGSWWGKSAFVLARLAHYYEIGNLLCVDPWSIEYLEQNDADSIVNSCIGQCDYDETLKIFEINLIPYNYDHINYLRMTSIAGAQYYSNNRVARTEAFGVTNYQGKIAILHIDGNHTYNAVKADVVAWVPYVRVGGWVIFDDYVWPYGNGPKRVGDEFLKRNSTKICSAFVMGSALFLQLIAPINQENLEQTFN
jgi:cephalosporin hydroxylase